MKLVFFNRFFFPDTSATSQLLADLAFQLASEGQDVHVVTSRLADSESDIESIRGVMVHRVARANTVSGGLVRRAIAYLNYYLGARRAAKCLISSTDAVILKTDPPLLSSWIAPLAKRRGAKVIVWLQDLFPEVAKEYGIPGMGGVVGAGLRRARNRSLAIADAVVAIGDEMAVHVHEMNCIERCRLHVIHNWADGATIRPIDAADNPLRKAWQLENQFLVVYSGNLGRVHEFRTLLDAATRLQAESDIRFVIIGRGPRLSEVQRHVERNRLGNVRFEPHQERGLLAQSLGLADVHVSTLRPEFEGLVHPSKLYGIMAAGRPTIFVGSASGETARILAETGSGISIFPGDSENLADAILRLRDDPLERHAMGRRAREAFELRFDLPIALAKWGSVLSMPESES